MECSNCGHWTPYNWCTAFLRYFPFFCLFSFCSVVMLVYVLVSIGISIMEEKESAIVREIKKWESGNDRLRRWKEKKNHSIFYCSVLLVLVYMFIVRFNLNHLSSIWKFTRCYTFCSFSLRFSNWKPVRCIICVLFLFNANCSIE